MMIFFFCVNTFNDSTSVHTVTLKVIMQHFIHAKSHNPEQNN